MIQRILISNDKSTIQVLPKESDRWFYSTDLKNELYQLGRMIHNFTKFMEVNNFCAKIQQFPRKYASVLYFKYFAIRQHRKVKFPEPPEKPKVNLGFYIIFNYIQYKNKCGFNYIIHNTDFNDIKPFIKNIILEYIEYLELYLQHLKQNWEKKPLGNIDRNYLRVFEDLIIKGYKSTDKIDLVDLSVTADLHFKNNFFKKLFFKALSNLDKSRYLKITYGDKTIMYLPYDKAKRKVLKIIPKIRVYDKQEDTIHRFYKEKIKKEHPIKIKKFDEINSNEYHENISIVSHNFDKLEKRFIDAYTYLENTMRFELEYSKYAIKRYFKTTRLNKLKLNNYEILLKELLPFLDMEMTRYKKFIFYDSVRPKKNCSSMYDIRVDDYIYLNKMSGTGDILDKFHFTIKEASFLNSIGYPPKEVLASPLYKGLTRDAIDSKKKRLRENGVIQGKGNNIVLNEPYHSLLNIYNYFFVIDFFKNKLQPERQTHKI